MSKVKVKVGSTNKIKVNINAISAGGAKVNINNTIVEVDPYPEYEGSYTFTSSTIDQTIETKERVVLNDITILKMPTKEVENETGIGFYIGGV